MAEVDRDVATVLGEVLGRRLGAGVDDTVDEVLLAGAEVDVG